MRALTSPTLKQHLKNLSASTTSLVNISIPATSSGSLAAQHPALSSSSAALQPLADVAARASGERGLMPSTLRRAESALAPRSSSSLPGFTTSGPTLSSPTHHAPIEHRRDKSSTSSASSVFVSADERTSNQTNADQQANGRPTRMRTSASANYLAGVEEEETAMSNGAQSAGKRMNSTRKYVFILSIHSRNMKYSKYLCKVYFSCN